VHPPIIKLSMNYYRKATMSLFCVGELYGSGDKDVQ